MKPITIRGWLARDNDDINEITLWNKKPTLLAGCWDYSNVADEYVNKVLETDLNKYKSRLKKGECIPVEIIIREKKK